MMELEELKSALNWSGVYQGHDSLIVVFNEAESSAIQGIKNNDDCFYLNYPEYQNNLISFLVIRNVNEMTQYWVLGDRLHRTTGPAKITMNSNTAYSKQSWYYNGIKHNNCGPAEIILEGHQIISTHPKTLEDIGPDYLIEEWDSLETYWYTHGIPSLYPTPHSALYKNGYRIFRTTSGLPVLDNFQNEPAFVANDIWINWNREGDQTTVDPFRIRHLSATGYQRSFTNGLPQKHSCDRITEMSWINDGEIIESSSESNETIRTDLFPLWNIWEGPLFPNDQEMIFAMQEVLK